jgi:hypothetical protein
MVLGRRGLIPWSRLVRIDDSEKPGITLGVQFVDSLYNHRIVGTVSMGLWWDTQQTFVRENDALDDVHSEN